MSDIVDLTEDDLREYTITKVEGNLVEFTVKDYLFHYYCTDWIFEEDLDNQVLHFLTEYLKHQKMRLDEEKNLHLNKNDFPKEWLGTTRKLPYITKEELAEQFRMEEVHQMETFRRVYRQFKKEEKNKKVKVNWLEQAKNLIGSLGDIAKSNYIDDKIVKERLEECYGCENAVGEINPRCIECGCFIEAKTLYKNEKCPIGKW